MLEVRNVGPCTAHPEIVKLSPKPGEQKIVEQMTIMSGGRIRVPPGYRLANSVLAMTNLIVTGTATPELPN